jgi:hypothetical protein
MKWLLTIIPMFIKTNEIHLKHNGYKEDRYLLYIAWLGKVYHLELPLILKQGDR